MIVVVQRHGTRLECGSSTIQLLRGWIPLDFKGAFGEKARHGRRGCCRDDADMAVKAPPAPEDCFSMSSTPG
jgi:hypothetical protein